jgi:hypothetical protein
MSGRRRTSSGVPSASGTAGSRDRRWHAEAEAARGAGRGGRSRGGRAVATSGVADHAGELLAHQEGYDVGGSNGNPRASRLLHYWGHTARPDSSSRPR